MSLQCQMSLNVATYTAGQSPAPQATLQVYNPNASAVVVTGIALTFADAVTGATINAAVNAPMPAMGPGATVVVPTLASITFGPFPIVVGNVGNGSLFLALPTGTSLRSPANIQLAQPIQFQLLVGAIVQGSDGSSNTAGVAPLMVAYSTPPPIGFQGGSLQLYAVNNCVTGLVTGVL